MYDAGVRSLADLADALRSIDGAGYGAYKRIKGSWIGDEVELAIDHVQGDPFATPSRVRLVLPAAVHAIPGRLRADPTQRTAIADFVLRAFGRAAAAASERRGSGASGAIFVDVGGAEVLPRSGAGFDDEDNLHLRFRVGLPARGRRVLGREAAALLTGALVDAAEAARWSLLDPVAAQAWVRLVQDHAFVQAQLHPRGLVAFVRDGAVLPRASGVSSRPLRDAVPFASPPSLRVTLPTQFHGDVTGLGLPRGVTVVTGAGFHGKTTLLEAIAAGIDPHMPGDGREWVVTSPDAVKVRSEDGRSVVGVDLRAFISDLPGGKDTAAFTSEDASGSTSLAAAIVESVELGASALLLDEDTCATNLLLRDARMQKLVARETITPLIDRIRGLVDHDGVSTVLVVGGNGDYLDVADTVIAMRDYLPHDVTEDAKTIAAQTPTGREVVARDEGLRVTARTPDPASFDPRRGRKSKVRARGLREIAFGEQTLDVSALEQLADDSQARAIGALLAWLGRAAVRGNLRAQVRAAVDAAAASGLYEIDALPELAGVRHYELGAAVNRLRSLRLKTSR